MGIKSKSCEEYTSLRERYGRAIPMLGPIHDVDALVAAVTILSTAAGTVLTLRTTVCPVPCTVALTQSASAGGQSVSVTIVGVNQFNEPVTEIVTMANPAVVKQSLNAFMRITSITLSAKAGTFTVETLEVGFARGSATPADRTQLGLPFKVKGAADIQAVTGDNDPADWVANKNVSTTYHTVAATDQLQTTMAPHMVILSATAQLKY